MGKLFEHITEPLAEFIAQQKLFFVATATADSKVNLSPKGMDSFKVLGPNRVIWLNVTGSGNETAAHVAQQPRMTIMFCAFEGSPMILRLYGQAKAVHQGDEDWAALKAQLPDLPGARQIYDVKVESVQTSCGMSVPFFDYQGEREQLNDWAKKKGDDGIKEYWEKKNQTSLDGDPTHILEKSI